MAKQESIWDEEYKLNKNKWNKETQTLPNILKGKSVLELGVGNGKTLKSILRQNPKQVTAIDFSAGAIEKSISLFKNKNILFKRADIKKLPFKKDEFDIVVCYYILNNLLKDERKIATSEIFRVLKRGGKVLFEDFSAGDFRETEKSNKITEKHTIQNKKGIICHFFTPKELKSLFNQFSKIKITKKISKPITHKPLKRAIISGIINK